jgi:hypothetical protein
VRKGIAFALVSTALIALGTLVLWFLFTDPISRRALLISAGLALGVQIATFALVRSAKKNVFAAWGVGALIRFVVLIAYGVLAPRAMGLPIDVALLSLALFLFVSTVVEPLFLKP